MHESQTRNLNSETVVHERLRRRRLASPSVGSPSQILETQATVAKLAREVQHLESPRSSPCQDEVVSTGCLAMDQCLPHGGYVLGSVIEYLRSVPASGASYLALAAAASAMQATSGYLVVIDTQRSIYPPALVAQGIDLGRVVFVRPESQADALWAVDQSLRTPAVAAVFAELHTIDDRSARRMQLAAEIGAGLALLVRSVAAKHAPSWAEVQWLVSPSTQTSSSLSPQLRVHRATALTPGDQPRRSTAARNLQVQLLRNRGGRANAQLAVAINSVTGAVQSERKRHEETATVRLATELASPKSPSRRTATG